MFCIPLLPSFLEEVQGPHTLLTAARSFLLSCCPRGGRGPHDPLQLGSTRLPGSSLPPAGPPSCCAQRPKDPLGSVCVTSKQRICLLLAAPRTSQASKGIYEEPLLLCLFLMLESKERHFKISLTWIYTLPVSKADDNKTTGTSMARNICPRQKRGTKRQGTVPSPQAFAEGRI